MVSEQPYCGLCHKQEQGRDKLDVRQIPPTFAGEEDIPQGSKDDTYIVRLAVESGAALVTADEPLREDLATSGIQARYNLRVLSPEGALAAL